jgi:hypothetical protein
VAFSNAVREEALFASKRVCCVCRAHFGRSVEVHHIQAQSDGGSDELDNAIVLCFDCHTEAGHYNPKHPRGSKYSPTELRRLRDEWLAHCATLPASVVPTKQIVVSPAEVQLAGAGATFTLDITNLTDIFFYDVTVKFQLDKSYPDAAGITFRLPPNRPLVEFKVGQVADASADSSWISGHDSTGNRAKFLFERRLPPRQTVTRVVDLAPVETGTGSLKISLAHASMDQMPMRPAKPDMLKQFPPEMQSGTLSMLAPFYLPEALTLDGMGIVMKGRDRDWSGS